MSHRHISLETKLAEARDVAVRRIDRRGFEPTPIWDFDWGWEMIAVGYEIAVSETDTWSGGRRQTWLPPRPIRARRGTKSAHR